MCASEEQKAADEKGERHESLFYAQTSREASIDNAIFHKGGKVRACIFQREK